MTRLYAALVRALLPSGFRARYGEEMEAFLAEGRQELSGWRRARFTARAFFDLTRTAVAARTTDATSGSGGPGPLDGLARDLQHGGRALRRRPGFTVAVVFTLALGVGAATAVFSVVDGVVLRPLPFDEPEALVSIWTTFDNTGDDPFGVSLAVQHDYLQETRAFETLGGFYRGDVTLTGEGPPRQVPVARLWLDVFGVTGTGVQRGRLPRPEETATGSSPVALVTASFWRQALQGDPEVVGRTLELDGEAVEILGVLEEDAWLPGAEDAEIWLPIQRSRGDITDRSGHSMTALARLAPGATLEDARRERDRVQERWREAWAGHHSPGHPGHDLRMAGAHEWYFGDLRSLGGLLLGASALLLLLACANVASLLLARGETRRAEMAVRRALGAGRGRLVRALLVEHALLAAAGGAVGLILAGLGVEVLLSGAPDGLPRVARVGIDGRVALFAAGASALAGLLFGTLPAFRGAGPPEGVRGVSSPGPGLSRSLHVLVAGQIALSVVLVSGAGVLTRSVSQLLDFDPGLDPSGRVVATLAIPGVRYPELEDVVSFWEEAVREAEALPGVASAAFSRSLPLRDDLRTEGMVAAESDGRFSNAMPVASRTVTPGYFAAAGIPVLEGRAFRTTDRPGARNVAVVNETAARRYFPDGAVGQVVQPLWVTRDHGSVEIVGVVGDVRHEGVRSDPSPELHVPLAQAASNQASWLREGTLVLRVRGDGGEVGPALREAVARLDPEVPVVDLRRWDDVLRGSVATERFTASVVVAFSLLALLLAAVGTYGVVSYTTSRRVREVGVRLALGAEPTRVVRELLARAGGTAAAGVGMGVVAALLAAPVLGSFVFGVDPRDPAVLAVAPLVMGLVALAAAAVPALRAGGTDPVVALRAEE